MTVFPDYLVQFADRDTPIHLRRQVGRQIDNACLGSVVVLWVLRRQSGRRQRIDAALQCGRVSIAERFRNRLLAPFQIGAQRRTQPFGAPVPIRIASHFVPVPLADFSRAGH
ncbi:MAG: hypothetical protein KDJ90_09410 [Nitratireductor sp.]|nr:hypothetical protein [Nitratireductor sp.]